MPFCLLLAAAAIASEDAAAPGYLLYTRRNGNTPQHIDPEVESLLRSSFYALEPIVVSIPRLSGNSSTTVGEEHLKLASALLEREACNVFAVDLAEGQSESDIVASVSGLLILLQRQFDVPLRQQQLVGFGEGAHLSGAVADQVQQQLGEQVPRITALDPSGDCDKLEHRLSAEDACLVEVMHTNGNGLGTMARLGDVDYYPNGGQQQPGCSVTPDPDACSHERALDLAAEMWSTANDFVGALCSSQEDMSAQNCRWSSQRMGVEATAGIFFLETRSSFPFGRGAYHIGFL
ncbi:pancreatic lipase-related protein 3 isoform X1 [Drosophila novamexicana]|uniref:pancreatic lipase-related protein 3 isoform X1 n=1 Tax=Drosophila novamexicana TaxID=47314 RepID=UPI0011E5B611|nr:pancreatic lipase-related protein 3 isoform X1 [Drosophila novamexicana]